MSHGCRELCTQPEPVSCSITIRDLAGKKWLLQDQLHQASYEWNGDDLHGKGLYLDMVPWQAAVFALVKHD